MTQLTPRERVSYMIKLIVASALYYARVTHLVRRLTMRNKAVVLMYHRVLTPEQRRRTASQPGLIVEAATFARQIAELKRHFAIVTLEEFEERLLNNEPFDDASCLITFDDGWIDNFENAWPVLRANGVPAAIFLAVNFIGRRRLFTREALTHLIVRAILLCRTDPSSIDKFRAILAPLELDHALNIRADDPLPGVVAEIESHKHVSGPKYEAVVDALARAIGVPADDLSTVDTFVDWTQVAEMRRGGVSFGGHGADHRVLNEVSPEVATLEVNTSADVIAEKLGERPRAFAYPNGGWNRDVAATVKNTGYRLAFTIEPGAVAAGDERYAVRRVNIHEGMTRSIPMFAARLAGIL